MKQQSIFDHMHTAIPITVWKIYVDGASRNNPGDAGAGIYIMKNDVTYKTCGYYLGRKTNNQAEYAALLLALWILKSIVQSNDRIEIYSDSQLLVRQLTGIYKVRDEKLIPLKQLAQQLLVPLHATIVHVMREENAIADEYANRGIESRHTPPAAFIRMLHAHAITW